MTEKWKLALRIFWTFFKISPATFGGGFAMIPLIEKEVVERQQWLTSDDVTDVLALSQTVPGAVALNSAIFIGHRIAGIRGALAAMIGVSLPTFLIVLTFGIFYFYIHDQPKLEAAFVSIRATIVAIIAYAAIKTVKTAIVDKTTLCIMLAGVPALFFIHPILIILVGGAAGMGSIWIKIKLGRKIKLEKTKKLDPNKDIDYFMGAGI